MGNLDSFWKVGKQAYWSDLFWQQSPLLLLDDPHCCDHSRKRGSQLCLSSADVHLRTWSHSALWYGCSICQILLQQLLSVCQVCLLRCYRWVYVHFMCQWLLMSLLCSSWYFDRIHGIQSPTAGLGKVKQPIFGAPFLAPSSGHGGEQRDS